MPRFLRTGRIFFSILLVLLISLAVVEYYFKGLTRKTFVFYTALEGATLVEDRMFRFSSSEETDIRRYVEEVLLGPVSPNAAPLFPRETRLLSLLLRDRIVYANFSEDALLPVTTPAGGIYLNFLTLNEGIRRNFSAVADVKFYIDGREIFYGEFHQIFTNFADNVNKTGQ